jgi:hypothetical protein
MAHPLVDHLRFTRSELVRGFEGVTEDEASQHFGSLNSLGWIVGHLAAQEQFYWHIMAQGQVLRPEVFVCASGQPMSTPSITEMWGHWQAITEAANPFLDTLTPELLATHLTNRDTGEPWHENIGTMLHRMTYHYWFHLGEAQAIRQLLGHTSLPNFVGKLYDVAYRAPGT